MATRDDCSCARGKLLVAKSKALPLSNLGDSIDGDDEADKPWLNDDGDDEADPWWKKGMKKFDLAARNFLSREFARPPPRLLSPEVERKLFPPPPPVRRHSICLPKSMPTRRSRSAPVLPRRRSPRRRSPSSSMESWGKWKGRNVIAKSSDWRG